MYSSIFQKKMVPSKFGIRDPKWPKIRHFQFFLQFGSKDFPDFLHAGRGYSGLNLAKTAYLGKILFQTSGPKKVSKFCKFWTCEASDPFVGMFCLS